MRKVIAEIYVDDDAAIEEGIGTLDYLEREFVWLEQSGITLGNARILDNDDIYDKDEIEAVDLIFYQDNDIQY